MPPLAIPSACSHGKPWKEPCVKCKRVAVNNEEHARELQLREDLLRDLHEENKQLKIIIAVRDNQIKEQAVRIAALLKAANKVTPNPLKSFTPITPNPFKSAEPTLHPTLKSFAPFVGVNAAVFKSVADKLSEKLASLDDVYIGHAQEFSVEADSGLVSLRVFVVDAEALPGFMNKTNVSVAVFNDSMDYSAVYNTAHIQIPQYLFKDGVFFFKEGYLCGAGYKIRLPPQIISKLVKLSVSLSRYVDSFRLHVEIMWLFGGVECQDCELASSLHYENGITVVGMEDTAGAVIKIDLAKHASMPVGHSVLLFDSVPKKGGKIDIFKGYAIITL